MRFFMRLAASLAAALALSIVFAKEVPAAEPARLSADTGKTARQLFDSNCVACHGDDGKGAMPGVHDLTGARGPLTQPDGVLIQRMLDGFQSPDSPMAMPPKGGNPGLTERDFAKLLDYMRSTFKP